MPLHLPNIYKIIIMKEKLKQSVMKRAKLALGAEMILYNIMNTIVVFHIFDFDNNEMDANNLP